MLLNFSFQNHLSFRDEVEFTCLATREKQHGERVFRHENARFRVLPIAALWGANGSGKSNLHHALQFARHCILRGKTSPEDTIDVAPFRLDPNSSTRPSAFTFDILVGDRVFNYSFAVNRQRVVSESLAEVKLRTRTLVYSRALQPDGETTVWNVEHFKTLDLGQEERQFIDFKTRDTLPNQLFLSELRGKKIPTVDAVGDWFSNKLVLLTPTSIFRPVELSFKQIEAFRQYAADLLKKAGTGIHSLATDTIALESLPIPQSLKEQFKTQLSSTKEGAAIQLQTSDRRRFLVFREAGDLKAIKLMANHMDCRAETVAFEMEDESEGTLRLIDLLPAFYELSHPDTEKVFVIDELDRTLHTLLTRALVESFLAARTPSSRGQLVFTTHDGMLLDQSVFRRDEVWFIDKDKDGVSTLSSLGDFDVRYDKDIRKSYLEGRFGGVPNIWGLPSRKESL